MNKTSNERCKQLLNFLLINWYKLTPNRLKVVMLNMTNRGRIIWLTGLSGAGKSTLAYGLKAKIVTEFKNVIVIDGDKVRHGISKDLNFSSKGKIENIRRIAELAKLCYDESLITIVASISPFRSGRLHARSLIKNKNDFIEVYVKASPDTVQKRDPKGIYKKFQQGQITGLSGFDATYEEPVDAEITIDTEKSLAEDGIEKIVKFLDSK